MPATAEQLLALLEAPHWKTPGSTSRRPEGPTGRRTEGQAAVNLTVVDHIANGRRVLADADRIAASGTTYDRARADRMRATQAAKSAGLLGDTTVVRSIPCLACGCYSLLARTDGSGIVRCANRHCAPGGVGPRAWRIDQVVAAKPVKPRGVRRTVRTAIPPRDAVTVEKAVRFFAPTAYPVSVRTVQRIIRDDRLPTWTDPANPRRLLVSLSDLMTAHAVRAVKAGPAECQARSNVRRPACAGLADLFYGTGSGDHQARTEAAKALCGSCPLREACLDQALGLPAHDQHGVLGGTTAAERRALLKTRKG